MVCYEVSDYIFVKERKYTDLFYVTINYQFDPYFIKSKLKGLSFDFDIDQLI